MNQSTTNPAETGCDHPRSEGGRHTPGPWIVFHADADGPNDVLPAMRPGCIARDIQSAADARMIAAAPVMDAALDRAWKALAWIIHYDSEDKVLARALKDIEGARKLAGTMDYDQMRAEVMARCADLTRRNDERTEGKPE